MELGVVVRRLKSLSVGTFTWSSLTWFQSVVAQTTTTTTKRVRAVRYLTFWLFEWGTMSKKGETDTDAATLTWDSGTCWSEWVNHADQCLSDQCKPTSLRPPGSVQRPWHRRLKGDWLNGGRRTNLRRRHRLQQRESTLIWSPRRRPMKEENLCTRTGWLLQTTVHQLFFCSEMKSLGPCNWSFTSCVQPFFIYF